MTSMDFNDAPEQREFDLIPKGTVATVQITIRAGGAGDGGWLKRSKDGGCEMLDIEYLVVDGQFARRKFWENLVVTGTTKGQQDMAEINRSKLRAILESARGVRPDDESPEAKQARRAEYKDLDGLQFIGRIGVEKGGKKNDEENYPDKNILDLVITPDKKSWHKVEQAPRPQDPQQSGGAVVAIKKPTWAQ